MLALHLRGNPRETLMGWYASTSEPLIADTSSLIHEFYAGESEDGDPVHLVVDTRLLTDALPISAYKSTPVSIQGEPLANLFHPVRLTLQSTEAAAICLDHMMPKVTAAATESEGLQASMETLLSLLETTSAHVDAVVNGTLPADPTVGRTIADTLAVIPKIRNFDKLFDDSLQDLLMVSYLSQITRTQLMVAQQLNASLGQI
jgi:translation initiation factor 3 subunit F